MATISRLKLKIVNLFQFIKYYPYRSEIDENSVKISILMIKRLNKCFVEQFRINKVSIRMRWNIYYLEVVKYFLKISNFETARLS
jgi:hypothetical protein